MEDIKSSDDKVLELQLSQLNSKFSDARKKFDICHKTIFEKEAIFIEEDERFKREQEEGLRLGKVVPKTSLMRREHEEQLKHIERQNEGLKNIEKGGLELSSLMKVVLLIVAKATRFMF